MNKKLAKSLGFIKEVKNFKSKKCSFCAKEINDSKFRDKISEREFKISGLCQECQDSIFK